MAVYTVYVLFLIGESLLIVCHFIVDQLGKYFVEVRLIIYHLLQINGGGQNTAFYLRDGNFNSPLYQITTPH